MVLHILLCPFLRKYRATWGTTGEEATAELPGDDLVPDPKLRMTWGITIDAPIETVWTWIVQIGQGRGGFYSYQLLENIVGCQIYNADHILPEHQRLPLETGIRLAPEMPPMKVALHEDGRFYFLHFSMNMKTMDSFNLMEDPYPKKFMIGGWAFYLEQISDTRTRFLSRWLNDYDNSMINKVIYNLFLGPIGFVMGRKMLLGVKQRAEG
jgi:hypothetical protein